MIVSNVVAMDGRLTLAPGVKLIAGDERRTAMMGDLADPQAWVRATHDPQVLLEGTYSSWTSVAPSWRRARGSCST